MSQKPQKKPRRMRRAVLWLAVLLLLLAAAAPTIVLNTPILASVLASAVPPEAGALTATGGAGGWLTPVALRGVELRGPQGNMIFQADEVRTSHNLPALIARSEPLKLLLVRPTVNLVVRPDGSNLQDLLTAIEQNKAADDIPAEDPSLGSSDISAIAVQHATVYVTEAVTGARWTHQAINVDVDLSDGLSKLTASGRLGAALGQFEPLVTGEVAPNFRLDMLPSDGASRSVSLQASGAPLNALTPLVHRADPTARVSGFLSGQGSASWNAPAQAADWAQQLVASGLQTEGALTINQFSLQASATGSDVLRLQSVQAPWKVAADGSRLNVQDLRIESELGAARARGALTAAQLRQLAAGELASASAAWPSGRVGVDVDVARLAQLAPAAVALRDDVRPVSGRVALELDNEDPSGQRLSAKATAVGFRGEVAGRAVVWEQPFTLTAALRRGPSAPVVETLNCQSEFLSGDLRGDLSNLQGNLAFDLDKLASQLGQFVDLRAWRLAGQGNAQLRTQRPAENQRNLTLVASMSDVIVQQRGVVLLAEPKLNASFSALATLDPAGKPARLETARAALESGADNLIVTLAQPKPLADGQPAPLAVTAKGELGSWQNRLRVALAPLGMGELLSTYRAQGVLNLSTSARIGAGVAQCSGAQAEVTNLNIDGGGLAVREKTVKISGDFAIDTTRGALESRNGVFQSSTVSFRSEGVRASGDSASGRIALRADLAKLNGWFVATARPLPTGSVEASVALSQQQGRLHASLNATGQQVAFLDAATRRPLLSEPNLSVVAETTYLSDQQQLLVDSATVTSNTIKVQATGGVRGGATQMAGSIDYDLDALAPVLAGYLGPESG